jgi:acetylornithine deacetylase/succinyl-diaminopimelate desuccinylase-like protein
VKYTVAAMLEAASFLKRRNMRPRRTVLFAFGHDEEVGGSSPQTRLEQMDCADFTLHSQVLLGQPILLRYCRQEAYVRG